MPSPKPVPVPSAHRSTRASARPGTQTPAPNVNPYGEWEPADDQPPPGAAFAPALALRKAIGSVAEVRSSAPSRWLAWAVEHDRAWLESVHGASDDESP